MAPVEHINGKMAPQSVKVKNNPTSTHSDVSFYYGYKRSDNPTKSHYGVRAYARNLSTNPYTATETANKDAFTAAVAEAVDTMRDPARRQQAWRDYTNQTKYRSFWGYVVATCRLN